MDKVLTLLPPDPKEREELACRALTALLGGKDAVDMLFAHHDDGKSHRELAVRFNTSHHAVGSRIRAAHRWLRELGIMPPQWEQAAPITESRPTSAA